MTSLARKTRQGLRALFQANAADRDLDDEIRHYREQLAKSLEERGVAPAEARRQAAIETGGALALREGVRDAGWESTIGGIAADCRHALRRLRRTPGFTLAATITLALGIGATAAIFTVADGVLLKPLPFPHAERLVALVHTAPGINLDYLQMSPSLYFTYREEGRVFEEIAIWNGNRSTVTGLGDPEEARTLFVTWEFLRVLSVQPALGRGFVEADGNGRTVLLSDAYWKQRYGGSPSAIGQRITLDGNPHEIIGVLPADFAFLDEPFSLIVPKQLRREELLLIQFSVDGIARLKPGVTLAEANADVARCLPLAPRKFPLNRGFAANAFSEARISPRLRWLKDHQVGDIGKTLWILMAAVCILLAIAGANVANLLLARAEARQQELAIREALGAGFGRIARDLLAESLILGLAGGLAGLGFCFIALRWTVAAGFVNLPRLSSISLDLRTVLFTFLISASASILFGLVPVWKYRRATRTSGSAARTAGGRSVTQSRERFGAQRSLLSLQVTLAMVLLVGSGLMLRTFQALRNVDPGFSKPDELQIVRVSIPAALVSDTQRVSGMEEEIVKSFAGVPGAVSVALTTSAPLEGGASNPVYSEGHDPGSGRLPPVRKSRSVSPGFVEVLGSRFVAGRDMTWPEIHAGRLMVLISENMARELWGDPQAAVGKRIRATLQDDWREIVGVVADLKDDGVANRTPSIVYWPIQQRNREGNLSSPRNVDYLIRSPRSGSASFVRDLQQGLREVNPSLPLANIRTLGAIYEKSMANTRFVLVLLALAGSMALLLGAIGLYALISYSVTQRKKEIGIRIALGSTSGAIAGMFVRQGLILAGPGLICGLLVSLAAAKAMQSLLFGVGPFDFATYGAMAGLLAAVATLASWLPSRRVASVDPIQALRAD
jgi:predicted permease